MNYRPLSPPHWSSIVVGKRGQDITLEDVDNMDNALDYADSELLSKPHAVPLPGDH